MSDLRLTIDGNIVPVGVAQFLLQKDPFPGGSRYEFVVPLASGGRWVRKWMAEIATGDHIVPGEQQEAFFWLNVLVGSAHSGRPNGEVFARFLLNNVESVHREDDVLIFSGVCSPISTPGLDGDGVEQVPLP